MLKHLSAHKLYNGKLSNTQAAMDTINDALERGVRSVDLLD